MATQRSGFSSELTQLEMEITRIEAELNGGQFFLPRNYTDFHETSPLFMAASHTKVPRNYTTVIRRSASGSCTG